MLIILYIRVFWEVLQHLRLHFSPTDYKQNFYIFRAKIIDQIYSVLNSAISSSWLLSSCIF